MFDFDNKKKSYLFKAIFFYNNIWKQFVLCKICACNCNFNCEFTFYTDLGI